MQPAFKHDTTLACEGVLRQGTAINFSQHIKKAFTEACDIQGNVKATVTQLTGLQVTGTVNTTTV